MGSFGRPSEHWPPQTPISLTELNSPSSVPSKLISQLLSPIQPEGLFARLRATSEDLATAQAKYDQLVQDPLVGLELVRSARRYLLSLQRRSRPYGWLYAPLAIALLGGLYPFAINLALQVTMNALRLGIVFCLFVVPSEWKLDEIEKCTTLSSFCSAYEGRKSILRQEAL